MARKDFPPISHIRQCLREENGRVFWLERPEDHFKNWWDQVAWNKKYAGKEAGWSMKQHNGKGRKYYVTIDGRYFARATIVWLLNNNEWVTGIDHINRNSMDDRIDNLRPSTQIQNSANMGIRVDNKTGYKGVSYRKHAKKYAARIKVNYKEKHLGYFDDPAEAHKAYLAAAKKYSGEFACGG